MRVWFNKTFSSIHSALRLIREADVEGRYELLASSPNPHALVKLVAHQFFDEPAKLTGAEYVEWCERFCVEHKVGIFVPGKEAALLAESHERFARIGTRIMSCASSSNLELIHNKGQFYATVNCPQAPSAEYLPCTNIDEFDHAYAELGKRHEALCLKPAVSVYGIGFRRIREDRTAFDIFAGGHEYQIDLVSLRTMLAAQASFPTLLVMEYLGGHEFSVDCVADHGSLKCAVARRKPLGLNVGQIIDTREDIQTACQQIAAQFGLNGYANIQFKEGRDGLRILEINPRMSGGVAMACLAGPNLPYLGLAGFDQGYDKLSIPPIAEGTRVGEYNQATVFL